MEQYTYINNVEKGTLQKVNHQKGEDITDELKLENNIAKGY